MAKKKALSIAEVSRLGGKATSKKYGRAHYVEMAKKSWDGRRKPKSK